MKIRFNLLPLQQKKHLHTQKVLRMIMEQQIYTGIVVGFFIMGLLAMYILLRTEAIFTKEVEQGMFDRLGYQEIIDIHEKFKSTHKKMASVEDIQKKHYHWSRVFVFLSENIVDGVTVEEFSTVDNHVKLRAVADKRETVVLMKEKMRDVKWSEKQCFENIVVPESDLATPVNVAFSMTLDVNVNCLY